MGVLSRILVAAAALLAAGCAELLPRSNVEVKTTWSSFEQARAAIESLEARHTSAEQLRAAGLDPFTNPNVELLSFSDILRRFPLPGNVSRLDPGLRECLDAGKACVGYAIDMKQLNRERVGPFVLDLLSFRRETHSSGWTFNALVLLVGDRVVDTLYGGKPSISERETQIEPLGPLQDWNGSGLIR